MPLDGYAESKPLGTGTLSQPAEMNRGGAVRVPEETVEAPPAQEREGATKELRSRALSAVAMVAGRNVAIKIVALAGNVVFARLLAPSAMGTVAFGLTMLMLVQLLSDGGLGVGLIRRPEEPALEDLRVLLGYQLALTLLLACVIAAVSAPLGRVGEITAVMMIGLPLLAFRAPSSIVYERNLDYRPLLTVEVLEELTYYTWGVSTVLLGAGVWGLASASIAKALVGTVVMLVISPVGRLKPAYSWRRLRPMLGFGLKFQAVEVAEHRGRAAPEPRHRGGSADWRCSASGRSRGASRCCRSCCSAPCGGSPTRQPQSFSRRANLRAPWWRAASASRRSRPG